MSKSMKGYYSLFLVLFASIAAAENTLVGVWQSNEELTVKYMNTMPNISDKKRNFLSNDFFGKEKVELTEQTITRESEIDGKVYRLTFDYQAVPLSGKSFEIVYSESGSDLETSETIHFENNCYYVVFDSQGLREYFCRVEPNS